MNIETITNSPQETIELGKEIGRQLIGGEIISLIGNLGTGKTHIIKGIAVGAGAAESNIVNSPTFVLINEYYGKFEIYHIDAYRLESEKEFENLGFDDICHPGSIVLIEWADKVSKILSTVNPITIELSHAGQTQRKIVLSNLPEYFTVD